MEIVEFIAYKYAIALILNRILTLQKRRARLWHSSNICLHKVFSLFLYLNILLLLFNSIKMPLGGRVKRKRDDSF